MSDIKSMGLYRNVDRIMADLASVGIGATDAVTVADLTPFDQYHYEGVEAVDDAARALRASPGTSVLDVGSGLGGPARYLASTTGCEVTALELQEDLNVTGQALTERCGLGNQVRHIEGDMLRHAVPDKAFDGLMSMLCFLHIPDRAALFASCAAALRPGARIFIDDYVARSPLTAAEQRALAEKVWCPYLPDKATYESDLVAAGFVDVHLEDKTEDWAAFVADRYAKFQGAAGDLVNRYDRATVESLDDFYATVADLFAAGNLGGLRLTARRATV